MKAWPTPRSASQSASEAAMNSRPLSERRVCGCPWRAKSALELPLHVAGADRACHLRAESDSRVLVDHVQDPKRGARARASGHEVVRPDLVGL